MFGNLPEAEKFVEIAVAKLQIKLTVNLLNKSTLIHRIFAG